MVGWGLARVRYSCCQTVKIIIGLAKTWEPGKARATGTVPGMKKEATAAVASTRQPWLSRPLGPRRLAYCGETAPQCDMKREMPEISASMLSKPFWESCTTLVCTAEFLHWATASDFVTACHTSAIIVTQV